MKTKVKGLYDMVLMLGDGSTWSMQAEQIEWRPIGSIHDPICFTWKPIVGRRCKDFTFHLIEDDEDENDIENDIDGDVDDLIEPEDGEIK